MPSETSLQHVRTSTGRTEPAAHPAGEQIRYEVAHVVPVTGIERPGVAQTHDEPRPLRRARRNVARPSAPEHEWVPAQAPSPDEPAPEPSPDAAAAAPSAAASAGSPSTAASISAAVGLARP